jgi:hypothetical protein
MFGQVNIEISASFGLCRGHHLAQPLDRVSTDVSYDD